MTTPLGKHLPHYREANGPTLQQVTDPVGRTKAYIRELEVSEMRERQHSTAAECHRKDPVMGRCCTFWTRRTPADTV